MKTYIFVCLAGNQVATAVDIQDLNEGAYRRHALSLLCDHSSAESVEVWRDEAVIDLVRRAGACMRAPMAG
jgi:hypothetical protein